VLYPLSGVQFFPWFPWYTMVPMALAALYGSIILARSYAQLHTEADGTISVSPPAFALPPTRSSAWITLCIHSSPACPLLASASLLIESSLRTCRRFTANWRVRSHQGAGLGPRQHTVGRNSTSAAGSAGGMMLISHLRLRRHARLDAGRAAVEALLHSMSRSGAPTRSGRLYRPPGSR
jgi:hypothetical protein